MSSSDFKKVLCDKARIAYNKVEFEKKSFDPFLAYFRDMACENERGIQLRDRFCEMVLDKSIAKTFEGSIIPNQQQIVLVYQGANGDTITRAIGITAGKQEEITNKPS